MKVAANEELTTTAHQLQAELSELMSISASEQDINAEELEEWNTRYFKVRDALYKWQGEYRKHMVGAYKFKKKGGKVKKDVQPKQSEETTIRSISVGKRSKG